MNIPCNILRIIGMSDNKCDNNIIGNCSEIENQLLNAKVELSRKTQIISEIENQKEILEEDLIKCKDNSELIKKEIDRLNNLIPKPDPHEEYWNNKYPKVKVFYTARPWGRSTKMIPVDVRLFITPQDYGIQKFVSDNGLFVKDFEFDIPRVYKFIMDNLYKYTYDKDNYGIGEFWEFPFEVLSNIDAGYDCDSWSNFISSVLIAGGVPSWKVRVVVGNCRFGGHSTMYFHSDESNRFHHLNSTSSKKYFKYLNEYPTSDDAMPGENNSMPKDPMGIYDVWFSLNNLHVWNKFTGTALESFNKQKQFKII